jgi:MFS family permease
MAKKDGALLEEELELSSRSGAAGLRLPPKFAAIFPALAHRNFQAYVLGQVISVTGFWLHQVAMAWLVFQLTHSAFWVGTTAAVGGLPFLIFTTFAGVFIDKVNKQKLLIWTQVIEALIALTIGILVLTNTATLPLIMLLVFVNGMVGSVDLPTRLTFILEMVGKRDLASAIPINNSIFNGARFVGPAIAGAMIASVGVAWPFIFNALSYTAGIWAILYIKPVYRAEVDVDTHPVESLKQGIKYSFTHPKILYFILLGFFSAVFIWPFQTLMPIVAQRVFASGAQGFGTLLSAAGAGSLAGAVFTSANAHRENKIPLVTAGLLIASLGLIVFSQNTNFALAHVYLFISGFGTLMMVATINTLVQLNSPEHMRARIMAVYLTMFVGMMPLGNELAGVIAERTSAIFTIGLGGALMLAVGVILYLKGTFTNLSQQE